MTEYERLFASLQDPISRRELLRRAGRGSLSVGAMALLAACGVQGEARRPQRKEQLPPKTGELVMANWPAYIDKDGSRIPTVETFEEQFNTDMSYHVVINDNEEFFGTIREPLSQGDPSGFDIIVMTDWMIQKMARLGYLEQLHHEELPNFEANAGEKFKDPWFDPDNKHSIPWAAGITGIGYDVSLTGRELTSVNDLFDPAFAGRVGLFLEMRDTFGLVLASMGIPEPEATVEDVEEAQRILLEHRDKIRGFYGNDYLDQLGTGNLAVSMAWSGDVFALSLDNPNLRFIVPEEGGMRWSDNMAIPAGAEHPTDAHEFMNFVYDPRIAANITEWVWYESPVEAVHQIVQEDVADGGPGYLKKLAESTLVFPTPETNEQTIPYKQLDEEEEQVWNDLYQTVVVG
ncbi:MAG: spermidine/putrescine ABC transporter substrate-binding protein [Actinomycetota bacterium]|nr:spermidine/putrescine ABC transporter substrate-binding protein [Actinomycetota bacterium]